MRKKIEFEAEREDKCYGYEERHELEGLETFQLDALVERRRDGQAFGNSEPLKELWQRWKIERLLEAHRMEKKRRTPGWEEIK